jgi:hypothetical protein
VTVRECDQNLGGQLSMATEIIERLRKQSLAGEDVLHRLSRIALAARPMADASQEVPSGAKSVVAAAKAFAERRNASGRAA